MDLVIQGCLPGSGESEGFQQLPPLLWHMDKVSFWCCKWRDNSCGRWCICCNAYICTWLHVLWSMLKGVAGWQSRKLFVLYFWWLWLGSGGGKWTFLWAHQLGKCLEGKVRQGMWQRPGSRGCQWYQGLSPEKGGEHKWAPEVMETSRQSLHL